MRDGASTWPWGIWVSHCPGTSEWREGGDLAGRLPEAMRGCSSRSNEGLLFGSPWREERPGKLELRDQDSNGLSSQYLGGVQRSGRVWEGTGHCYRYLADPGGDWRLRSIANTAVPDWSGWAQAIVNMSGLQVCLCTLLLLPRQVPKRVEQVKNAGGVASCP